MTIATSGRGHQEVLTADVFSWSELPELLAAEDLFDAAVGAGLDRLSVLAAKDEDDDFDDDEDEDEDDEDEDEDDEELEDEDDEWEEVEDDEVITYDKLIDMSKVEIFAIAAKQSISTEGLTPAKVRKAIMKKLGISAPPAS